MNHCSTKPHIVQTSWLKCKFYDISMNTILWLFITYDKHPRRFVWINVIRHIIISIRKFHPTLSTSVAFFSCRRYIHVDIGVRTACWRYIGVKLGFNQIRRHQRGTCQKCRCGLSAQPTAHNWIAWKVRHWDGQSSAFYNGDGQTKNMNG